MNTPSSINALLQRDLFEVALDCVIIIDAEGVIVEFNPAAENTFGFTRAEAVGQELGTLLVPENLRAAHRAGLERYLETGVHAVLGRRIEVPALHSDNHEIVVELAITPLSFDGAQYFAAFLRDVSEVKAQHERLATSERKYQDLFEMASDALIVYDLNGRVSAANKRAETLTGRHRDQICGSQIEQLHPETERHRIPPMLERLKQKRRVNLEISFSGPDDQPIPTEVNARLVDIGGEELVHAVVRNISERIAARHALEHARDAAERASSAKSDFLANVSHEMRTPLNGVLGPIQLINKHELSPEHRSLLEMVESSATQLSDLIGDVLDISRIESGHVELEYAPFALRDIAYQATALFQARADAAGLTFCVEVDHEETQLIGDAKKIGQVLQNLIGNALKFTSEGSITVRMNHQATADPGLHIEVSDTGTGISPSDQEKVFERFEQGASATSNLNEGLGLGLAICGELVHLMGGKIGYTTNTQGGATFRVDLPLELASVSDRDSIARTTTPPDLAGVRVLLAEDSATNQLVAEQMLSRAGARTTTVANGRLAVERALAEEFDVILMDLAMPEMDGIEATRRLRALDLNTPIIALTAHVTPENRTAALDAGMDDFLTKPVDMTELHTKLVDLDRGLTPSIPIDLDFVKEQWADSAVAFEKVLEIFERELRTRMQEVAMHLANKDAKQAAAQCHAISGAARNVGATRIADHAKHLQLALVENDLEPEPTALRQLEEATAEFFGWRAETEGVSLEN